MLAYEFEMKDLGMMHYFLGLKVWQRTDEIFLSQGKYIVEILKKFGMLNLKPMATPMVMNMAAAAGMQRVQPFMPCWPALIAPVKARWLMAIRPANALSYWVKAQLELPGA